MTGLVRLIKTTWWAGLLVVVAMSSLLMVMARLAANPQIKERNRLYGQCIADGKPEYACRAFAREATR